MSVQSYLRPVGGYYPIMTASEQRALEHLVHAINPVSPLYVLKAALALAKNMPRTSLILSHHPFARLITQTRRLPHSLHLRLHLPQRHIRLAHLRYIQPSIQTRPGDDISARRLDK